MMLDNYFSISIWEYLINFIIFGQCLFFMLLYEKSITYKKKYNQKFIEDVFYLLSLTFIFSIYIENISYNFYKSHLLIQYAFLVHIAYYKLKNRYNVLTAISLSFLLVFLNSYFWEAVLHIMEYNTNPLTLLNFRETYHLIVIPFLINHYWFDKKIVVRKIGFSFCISFLVSVFVFEVIPFLELSYFYIPFFLTISNISYFFNRVICLLILLDIMNNHSFKKKHVKGWFNID